MLVVAFNVSKFGGGIYGVLSGPYPFPAPIPSTVAGPVKPGQAIFAGATLKAASRPFQATAFIFSTRRISWPFFTILSREIAFIPKVFQDLHAHRTGWKMQHKTSILPGGSCRTLLSPEIATQVRYPVGMRLLGCTTGSHRCPGDNLQRRIQISSVAFLDVEHGTHLSQVLDKLRQEYAQLARLFHHSREPDRQAPANTHPGFFCRGGFLGGG